MGNRLNIGLLVDDMDAVFTREACKGAEQGAIDIDANMFVIPGGYLDSSDAFDAHQEYGYQYNALFGFINEKHIDVLYVMMGMIGCRVDLKERIHFLERYAGIPIITLYSKMDGYPSVTFDNRIGFDHAIQHLIEHHNVRRIGFVSGPKTNTDAMERLDVYKTVLERWDIPYREEYVVYGNFEETSGVIAARLYEAHEELQAIVFANDRMAQGGYEELQKMGIEIGSDLLVIGFDNSIFAPTLSPPLTTVEANAAELAYYAVIHAEKFLATGKMENLEISTHFVQRSSCGCQQYEHRGVKDFDDLPYFSGDEICIAKIHDYLFAKYIRSKELTLIKDEISILCNMLWDVVDGGCLIDLRKDCEILFLQLLKRPLLQYTTVEQLFFILTAMKAKLSERLTEDADRIAVADMFGGFYQKLSLINYRYIRAQQEQIRQLGQVMSNMTSEIFMMNNPHKIPYASALRNMYDIGIKSSYIYMFSKPVVHTRDNIYDHPKTILLKAYCHDNQAFDVPSEKQSMHTNQIMTHDKIRKEQRVTMVLSPIFSGIEMYGLLLCEVNWENFKNVAPAQLQLSIAIKSLMLIEQQGAIQKKLEASLFKIKENNSKLDELSKSDELTKLYNRRGFLEYAKEALCNKRNMDKYAMILYADMDNLKMINDEYGHEEGDFALKEMAAILKEAVRTTDIVARFGGDEFVIFALVGVAGYENIMKRRIAEISARHNTECGKPYPIEMSVGVCEFVCGEDVDIYGVIERADERLYEEKRAKKAKNGSYQRGMP